MTIKKISSERFCTKANEMRLITASIIFILSLLLAITFSACSSTDNKPSDDDSDDDTDDDTGDDDNDDDNLPNPCADIYAQDILPTFEVEIAPEEWDEIVYEYEHWQELNDQGLPIKVYHPLISFRYKDEVINDAMIRLRGSPDMWIVPKMQFKISFNEIDANGRFHGLRKINFDASAVDSTILRERLGSSYFQDLGIPVSCANNAKLVINGEYYGLYTNIENVDKEFLKRNFGKDHEGNLYKYIWLETNEDAGDTSDMDAFMSNPGIDILDDIVDLDEAILEWAGEAVIPHDDGFFVGGINYYMYDHPKRGFIFIPWDIDYAFEIAPVNADLITYEVDFGIGKPPQFTTVISDPEWYQKYLNAVATALSAYDVETLQNRIDQWEEQIIDAIEEDPNKHFTTEDHINQVAALRQYIEDRHYFVALWLNCKRGEGEHEIVNYGDQQYYLWYTQCSWPDAEDFCESMGGTLAVPADEAEQTFLATEAFGLIANSWWIGANDIAQEGTWVDPVGVALSYLPWAPDQPNGGEQQNCAVLDQQSAGLWNDKDCQEVYPSVCKLP